MREKTVDSLVVVCLHCQRPLIYGIPRIRKNRNTPPHWHHLGGTAYVRRCTGCQWTGPDVYALICPQCGQKSLVDDHVAVPKYARRKVQVYRPALFARYWTGED
jgi:hypothetical protein